ncbi:hypothetical protein JCM10550A_15770 [Methanogenium cariaci]|jgi:hypothetical protein
MKYRYIGPEKLLSPCKKLGLSHPFPECSDGQCQGYVDGMCPFTAGRLNGWRDEYFEEVIPCE